MLGVLGEHDYYLGRREQKARKTCCTFQAQLEYKMQPQQIQPTIPRSHAHIRMETLPIDAKMQSCQRTLYALILFPINL